jgi:AcrR family transcriptional regulator
MAPRRAAAIRHGDPATTLSDHLVAATDTLLDDAPIGSLTTRRIARAAGVSDGVLYNHFADKSELILAALVRRYERLLERFERGAPTVGQGNVDAGLTTFAGALAELDTDVWLIGASLLADPPLLGRFWTEIHRRPFGLARLSAPLVSYLTGERDAGRLASELDVDATVTLVFGAAAMSAITRHLNPGTDAGEIDRQLAAAIETIVVGIGPRT